jgi:hypothetical protein
MRSLLLTASEDEERRIVLFREEFERRGVVEGMDGVLLGELFGERQAEGVQVIEGVLSDLRA